MGTAVAHMGVKKIAMTGSTQTGKAILAACASQLKRVSLELGGNCPTIVGADADLDLAAKIIAYKAFRNMGQSCSSVNRVYAHESVHDALAEKLATEAQKLTLGDPVAEPGCDLGPFTTEATRENVEAHVADALAKGAVLLCGGKRPYEGWGDSGFGVELGRRAIFEYLKTKHIKTQI